MVFSLTVVVMATESAYREEVGMQERECLCYCNHGLECITKGNYCEVRADCRDRPVVIPAKRDIVLSQPAE